MSPVSLTKRTTPDGSIEVHVVLPGVSYDFVTHTDDKADILAAVAGDVARYQDELDRIMVRRDAAQAVYDHIDSMWDAP